MKIVFLLVLMGVTVFASPQHVKLSKDQTIGKRPIDFEAINSWPYVALGKISNHGDYASYVVTNQPVGSSTLVIRSTTSDWSLRIIGGSALSFANDGKIACFKLGADSLCLLTLKTGKKLFFEHIQTFEVLSNVDSWIAFRSKSSPYELTLLNLNSGKTIAYDSIVHHAFGNGGRTLFYCQMKATGCYIHWVNLTKREDRLVWSSQGIDSASHFTFDYSGDRVAFLTRPIGGTQSGFSIWYFQQNMARAAHVLTDSNLTRGETIAGQEPVFDQNGKALYLQVHVTQNTLELAQPGAMQVWNSLAGELPADFLNIRKKNDIYTFCLNLDTRHYFRVEKENETILNRAPGWCLALQPASLETRYEAHWNASAQLACFLVSTVDGHRQLVLDKVADQYGAPLLSPKGKWALWYSRADRSYCTYELATGIKRTLKWETSPIWTDEEDDHPEKELAGPVRWLENDEAMLIEDTYDIWQVDPSGSLPPVNITGRFGRTNHIKLRISNEQDILNRFSSNSHSTILLEGIDKENKDHGYYKKTLGTNEAILPASIGPYRYESPITSADGKFHLLARMTATSSPNYFVTRDFKIFKQLSDIHPESQYNWLKSALVHWNLPDGKLGTGMLYTPDDLDTAKKYPLLINLYEKRSDELNLFRIPKVANDEINIPWYVSRGYIVFVPDISYEIGEPGQSAYKIVESAARYLSTLNYLDSSRFGIQGHSFGGYETEYIVTHTPRFAAACAASGVSNLISVYGSRVRGSFMLYWAELYQGRLGATLWEDPERYIRNSPIFSADKLSTPLLILQNKGDDAVPFSQGMELFSALRRLKKPAWLLQYDDGIHEVYGQSAVDFTIKMTEFFDFYLQKRDKPAWMQ